MSWASTEARGDCRDDCELFGETGSETSSIGPGRVDSRDSLGAASSCSETPAIDKSSSVASAEAWRRRGELSLLTEPASDSAHDAISAVCSRTPCEEYCKASLEATGCQ